MKKENLYKLIVAIIMAVIGWYVTDQSNTNTAQWRAIGEIRKEMRTQ
jgi:hypothetical protein|tara:strand:- start:496 stop:636 length:141 start_codon:yes stop_codon:yes gene_type:complete